MDLKVQLLNGSHVSFGPSAGVDVTLMFLGILIVPVIGLLALRSIESRISRLVPDAFRPDWAGERRWLICCLATFSAPLFALMSLYVPLFDGRLRTIAGVGFKWGTIAGVWAALAVCLGEWAIDTLMLRALPEGNAKPCWSDLRDI